MAIPLRPKLRPVDLLPCGGKEELLFEAHDCQGFGRRVILPFGGALLAALMDGHRTLAEIQAEFTRRLGSPVALADLKRLVRQLDEAYLLEGERFQAFYGQQVSEYLSNPVRPAAHAGASYARDPQELRRQLEGCFAGKNGPGLPEGRLDASPATDGRPLCGVVSPHVDLYRGGRAFASAYRKIVEQTSAERFVIFGTAHAPMNQWFCVSRKDFDTPLGVVQTDRAFVDRVSEHLASSLAGQQIDLFEDELAHRHEHSIEFQAVWLQYVLGPRRPFRIVPVLVSSFREFMAGGDHPDRSPEVQAFVAAICATAAAYAGEVCYIGGADLAHIGPRFGDEGLLNPERLGQQAEDDRELLEAACRGDSTAFFQHVADQNDRNRICGLSAMYTLLEVVQPARGELLAYDQAVEPDGSACVSFASVALYRE